MSRSLTRCQFVAFGAGVLLCGTLIGLGIVLRPLQEWVYQHAQGYAVVIQYILLLLLPLAFAVLVARYARGHDKVAFITLAVPASAAFLVRYAFDIKTQIESVQRHFMTGGVLGYVPPLDVIGQFFKVMPMILGVAVLGFAAIAINRVLFRRHTAVAELAAEPASSAFRWFTLALLVTVAAGLIGFSIHVFASNTPEALISHARAVLGSPDASLAKKRAALFDIWRLRNADSSELLREAAAHQPSPLNVMAAAFLAERNDITFLPLLEKVMMISSDWKTAHTRINLGALIANIRDPAAVPALSRLMKSPDPNTREGAARALRRIKSQDAVEALVEGLSDANWEVRWHSVLGLAGIVGHPEGEESWAPARETFQNDEQRYLDHWKDWAESRPGT